MSSTPSVSLHYQKTSSLLARSSVHQSPPITSKTSPLSSPPASDPGHFRGRHVSLETGISKQELQRSYVDKLIEPAISVSKKASSDSCKGLDADRSESFLFSQVGVWFRLVVSFVALFRVYLQHVGIVLVTTVAVLLACSLRGDLVLFSILTYKSYYQDTTTTTVKPPTNQSDVNATESLYSTATTIHRDKILPDYLQLPDSYNLSDLLFYMGLAIFLSELMYHVLCGFFQLYFYTMQRDQPEKWKCQPHRFLTRSNEMHEIIVGTSNMFLAGGMSGFLTCWVVNGNYSTVYFRIEDYGYLYFFFSILWLFVWLEASAYYSHALLHTPWLYKNIHKHHHRYHSPTAYSVIAMSPFEVIFYDSLFIIPLFVFPIHGLVYVAELVYVYYFGLMDHSGIKMESWFPWQPDSMFHDDHHRYFHCNFGFNASWFDRLHGTMRKKDRAYGENVFGGKGKKL